MRPNHAQKVRTNKGDLMPIDCSWLGSLRFPDKRCKNATRRLRPFFVHGVAAAAFLSYAGTASAQRAKENAVAEASDAFGTSVGREEIGLYSSSNARGFSPSQAGNLRIDGLYFDQAQQARLNTRIVRGSTVHVGISAQGYPFPAPTGVIDYHLRAPAAGETTTSVLVGGDTYNQAYGEADFQTPVAGDVLSLGGGVNYMHNNSYRISERSWEWGFGALARWRPSDSLVVTPFWSYTDHQEREERPYIFIGNNGVPRYRPRDLGSQPWTDYGFTSSNYGVTAHYAPEGNWAVDAGIFRSQASTPVNYEPLLTNVAGNGAGNYAITAAPERDFGATSGEVRYSHKFDGDVLRNTFYATVRGRTRSNEAGGQDTINYGAATLYAVPQVPRHIFNLRPVNVIKANQITPGVGYEGTWRGLGQLSVGVQKTFYNRTIAVAGSPEIKSRSKPWLYNVSGAGFITSKFAVYASYTRGFEEIGIAPVNAANRDEAVPAQLTEQIDAGFRYLLTPRLTLVAGVFKIEKPFFNLDNVNIYRQLGITSNKGIEVSLAGNITDALTVVAGGTFIDPKVDASAGAGTATSYTSIGPVPGLVRVNFQYRTPFLKGLMLDTKIERTSRREANLMGLMLPSAITFDAGARYTTEVMGRGIMARLQASNLTNEYVLTPSPSGQIQSLDGRRVELSLTVDF